MESARAPGIDFPLQNLPFGAFDDGRGTRPGVAIGDAVLDLAAAGADGLLDGGPHTPRPAPGDLTQALRWTPAARRALRHALHALLHDGAPPALRLRAARHLRPASEVALRLGWRPPDLVDFFASRHHATNVAAVVPGARVPPAFDHLPLGYHGRASTVVLSGTPVRRPFGQRRARNGYTAGPSRRLDFEAELGLVVGPDLPPGLAPSAAGDHLFGVCLLNDWSARDLQALESEPLGPFQSKGFCSSISPWVVTREALAPFRVPWDEAGRAVPAYLRDAADAAHGALAVTLRLSLQPAARDRPLPATPLVQTSAATLAWTPQQLLAHLASTGAPVAAGTLAGTGTVSGEGPDRGGSLVELSHAGRAPVALDGGVTRTFLEDGDQVVLTAACEAPGAVRIGFGECRGTIAGAATT